MANRLCTESPPGILFFIGSSPSQAATIVNPDFPCAGVMISVNQLQKRKSDFVAKDWILDSGAFTEISRYGQYRSSVGEYAMQIRRWSQCGNLLIAVSQDWMCEPFILERTGLTVTQHQQLTIERYDALLPLVPQVPIMPVIQGYKISEYLSHIDQYGDRLLPNMWVGVGSVCKRNSDLNQIEDILASIKNKRPDLRLHGFGLKQTALESPVVQSLLYSCDSMAWSYPLRFKSPGDDFVQNQMTLAHKYQVGVQERIEGSYVRKIPRTSGAGNGQGRKPKWSHKTKPVRLPVKFRNGKSLEDLKSIAQEWDK
ncbi:MAG: hypothetical protein HWQ38_37840 [Nostoc sp. NMS7]|nr:hypothetical protein [Nostoc sp. NMS7]